MEAFLTHLAVERQVSASTQRQALSALAFLYREVLEQASGWLENIEPAKKPARLPVVFTRAEARAVLACLDGQPWLMACLLYGAGLRLMECVRLRVKDVDFGCRQIVIRDGEGQKDRLTMLPQAVVEPLTDRCIDSLIFSLMSSVLPGLASAQEVKFCMQHSVNSTSRRSKRSMTKT